MNTTTPVHAEELNEWADTLGWVEDWLLRAREDTIADYHEFHHCSGYHHRGDCFAQLVDELGRLCVRMRRLAQDTTS